MKNDPGRLSGKAIMSRLLLAITVGATVSMTSCVTGPSWTWTQSGVVVPTSPAWRFHDGKETPGRDTFSGFRAYLEEREQVGIRQYWLFWPDGHFCTVVESNSGTNPPAARVDIRGSVGLPGFYRLNPSTSNLDLEYFSYSDGSWSWQYVRYKLHYDESALTLPWGNAGATRLASAHCSVIPDW